MAVLCFRQGSVGLSNERLEGVAFMHCDIGQDLAIQFDTRKLQTVHELAIGQAFHAYGGVDALNPERTEAALLYLAIAIGVLASLFDCLPRDADGVLAAAIIALQIGSASCWERVGPYVWNS